MLHVHLYQLKLDIRQPIGYKCYLIWTDDKMSY